MLPLIAIVDRMRRTIGFFLAIFAVVPLSGTQKIRGMNFAHSLAVDKGYGSPASRGSLRELHSLGVESIAIMPFGFQRHPADTEIIWVGHGGRWIGETDERLRAV